MNLRISTLSPLLAITLAACGVPDSPTLELGPDSATTTDALALTLSAPADAPDDVDYSVSWARDGELLDTYADALMVPASATAKGQTWVATATPINARGREGEPVSVEITIENTAPTGSVSIAEAVVPTTADLKASALITDVDDDAISLEWSWLKDGEKTGITTDTVPAAETSKGEIWTVVVVPSDDEVSGEAVQATVSIDNSLPVAQSVSLSPEAPMVTDAVVASAVGSDLDGDALTWSYIWTVDGEVLDGVNGPELAAGGFTKGEIIHVQAVPNDGFVDGEAASASVTAINSVPSVEAASVQPAAVYEADVASCEPSGWSDADGDPAAYSVTWEVNGVQVAETPTVSGNFFDRGNSIVCVLTPDDGESQGVPVRSASSIVQNTAPTLSGASLDSTSPTTQDALTATAAGAADVDGDDISMSFAWSVNGSVVWTESSEGAQSTLSAEWYSKGDSVSVSVTPEDDADTGLAVVSGVATVVNAAPSLSSIGFDSTSPKTGDLLTATANDVVDPDGDSVSLSWAWSVNGSLVSTETTSGTSASLDGAAYFDSGDVITVTVTPDDGSDSGAAVTSSIVTAVNTLPTLDSVAVAPTSPGAEDDVTATVAGAEDVDGDSMTFTYVWSVNGTEVSTDSSTSASASLGASNYGKGDSITVSVTAADADGSSSAVVSSAVSVVNTPPVATAVALDVTSPKTDDSVVATVTASDDDGDVLSYDWSWTVDGTEVFTESTSSTSSTLDGSTYFGKGQVIVATATPKDEDGAGTSATSASATAVNTAPVVSTAILGPDPLKEGGTAIVTAAAGDADADTLTYSYAWTVNGTAAGSSATLSASSFDKGDTVQVTVTADDGSESGSKASNVLTVANTAPTAPEIDIDPIDPDDADELYCDITTASSDVDGDTITYDITWTRDGADYTGATSTTTLDDDTIAASNVSACELWSCSASAFDGTDSSAEVISGDVFIRKSGTSVPTVGQSGSLGVISGAKWQVCRADSSTAWVAHQSGGGRYDAEAICCHLGYAGVDAQGGTWGTTCGYNGVAGKETYDGGGGSTTSMGSTVHWRCAN